jgi:hypothetical protein
VAILAGLGVAGAYLLGASVSGRLDPSARRPIFDGFAPPPPYRWVSPPPAAAQGNQKPAGGRFRVKFDAGGISVADVLSTSDLQVTLILSEATFVPMAGQTSALISVQPLAPEDLDPAPPGLRIAGNVYRLQGTYRPSGTAVSSLSQPAELTLVYPPSADGLIHAHTVLQSRDGTSWTALPTNDAGSQAAVEVSSLGYFAVAERVTGGKRPFPLGKIIQYALIGALVLVLAVPIVAHEVRSRRSRRSLGRRATNRSRRR